MAGHIVVMRRESRKVFSNRSRGIPRVKRNQAPVKTHLTMSVSQICEPKSYPSIAQVFRMMFGMPRV